MTKQQILRITDKVDEIRVHAFSYSPDEGAPVGRIAHRYKKQSADFAVLLDALKNSANEGSYARAIGNRTIVLVRNGEELMKLEGYSGTGQFAWSELEGMQSRHNHIYLSSEGKRLVE